MKKLFILALVLLTCACTKPEEKIKNYLANGKSLYEKGDYNKAKIEFKNVLQLDSKQSEAFYHLALIDEQNKNWQGMYGNLMQVARLNPKNNEALLKLARLDLLSGQLDETLKQTETVLKNSPGNPDALALKGAVLVKKNNQNEAMALAEQILKDHPDHTDAISLKTVIFMAQKDFAAATATVENALKNKPNDIALLQLKLQLHTQSKDTAAVERDYLDFVKLFPDKAEYSYALAKHYADIGQHDKALSTLQGIIDKHPDQLQPKLVLVDYQMQHAPEVAEQSLNQFIGQFPDKPDLHFRLATLYLKKNKIAEAKQSLNKIVELKDSVKEANSARIMLAKMALQDNDVATANNYINDILGKDKRNLDAHLLKAKLDLQKGLTDEVISDLRGVLRDFSNSDQAYVLLGQAYVMKKSPELAEENFRKALEIDPANFEALLPVVSTMVKNQDSRRAEELLQKALAKTPDHLGALQALVQIKLLQKDWTAAQKIADTLSAQPQSKAYGKMLSGKIAQQRDLCKEAIGQYKEALTLAPGQIEALQSMAACHAKLKQDNAMLSYLDEFMAAHPDNGYAPFLKSQLLLKNDRKDDALSLLLTSIEKWPKAADMYELAAGIYAGKKDYDKAVTLANQGLEKNADPVRMNLLLASLHEQSGAYDKALPVYNTILEKNPNVDIAVNNLVSLLLDHFNTKENVERAVELAKRFEKSTQPYYLDSYGWALFNKGSYVEAVEVFKTVVAKMQNPAPVFRYHLAMAYEKTAQKAEAIKELEKALSSAPQAGGFAEKEAAENLLKQLKQ